MEVEGSDFDTESEGEEGEVVENGIEVSDKLAEDRVEEPKIPAPSTSVGFGTDDLLNHLLQQKLSQMSPMKFNRC